MSHAIRIRLPHPAVRAVRTTSLRLRKDEVVIGLNYGQMAFAFSRCPLAVSRNVWQ